MAVVTLSGRRGVARLQALLGKIRPHSTMTAPPPPGNTFRVLVSCGESSGNEAHARGGTSVATTLGGTILLISDSNKSFPKPSRQRDPGQAMALAREMLR